MLLLDLPASLAARAPGAASEPNTPLFREVGRNTLKVCLGSHPDVTAAHYAGLLLAEAMAARNSFSHVSAPLREAALPDEAGPRPTRC